MSTLHYKSYGDISKPALVIVHGLFGSLDNWMTLAKSWSEQYYVIAIDVRNHGKSFHSEDMKFESLCLDIIQILNLENISKIHLLGHSMGGKIAMEFAAIYPQYLDKLIIVDVAPYAYNPHHNDVFNMIDHVNLDICSSRAEVETQIRVYLQNESTVLFMSKNIRRNEDSMRFEWKFNYPTLKSNYEYLIQDIPQKGYTGSVLFIGGQESDYITSETSQEIFELYPNFELEYVSNAGHWVHADNPVEFSHKVIQFLQK